MKFIKLLGAIILGLWGLFCIIMGITDLTTYPLGAIIIIISGLCCTPLYTKVEKRILPNLNLILKVIIRTAVIILTLVVGIGLAPASNTPDVTSDTQVEEQTEESNKSPEEIKAEYIESTKEYSYEEVFRNSEEYFGKPVVFTGEISQVKEDDEGVLLHINVTEGEYGIWSDDMAVYLASDEKENDPEAVSRFMEDDIITVYGDMNNPYTYTTILNEERTIPAIYARYIKLK